MRFLKLLVRYLLWGGGLLALITLLVMYGLAYFQAAKVVAMASSAKQMSRRPAHVADCFVNSADENYPLKGYQVRFLDETTFVLEAVCASVVRGPFEVLRGQLKYGTTKLPGYSGVIFPVTVDTPGEASMQFRLGYAIWSVTVGTAAHTSVVPLLAGITSDTVPSGSLAASASCEGWGYACCNNLTQVGEGETMTRGIMSCAGGCYTRCLERPSILIFTSDPMPDPKTRELTVKRGSLVVFSYGVQDTDSASVSVTIDYGDGEAAVSTNQTDEFSHVYMCAKERCAYTSTLSVLDTESLDNSRTRISALTVNVR